MPPAPPIRPPPSVLDAFGLTDPVEPMAGMTDPAWHAGDAVLKRVGGDRSWVAWEERVLAAIPDAGFRLQRPRRALDGSLTVDGWRALDYLGGSHRRGQWSAIIDAGDALHAALGKLPDTVIRPFPTRSDPWSIADRVAWDEIPTPEVAHGDPVLLRLFGARGPVDAPSQLVHGDLTGNVLFADGLPPAIIDFSPYLRPAAYGVAIVVADAVVWEGGDLTLLERGAGRVSFAQCLIRALIFRHVTALLLRRDLPAGTAGERYARLVNAAIQLAHADRR